MAQWILMSTVTGDVYPDTLRNVAPSAIETNKGRRWLTVTPNNPAAYQTENGFPASLPTNATTIARNLVNASLASWKARRKQDLRDEQWRRIAQAQPLGKMIAYYATAIRLSFKKANGNNLTAGESTTMTNINTVVTGTIEPISAAADTACDAVDAAVDLAGVETAYAAVAWP